MSEVVDIPAVEVPDLEENVLTLSMKVKTINILLNALNKPLLTDAVTLVTLINEIQAQCIPQMDALTGANKDEPQAAA